MAGANPKSSHIVSAKKMETIGIVLTALATLTAIVAIFYQRLDHTKDYGSTMGGDMTSGAIWSLAALLAGIGLGMLTKWYWGIAAFVVIYAASFLVRGAVERALLNRDRRRPTNLGGGTAPIKK